MNPCKSHNGRHCPLAVLYESLDKTISLFLTLFFLSTQSVYILIVGLLIVLELLKDAKGENHEGYADVCRNMCR